MTEHFAQVREFNLLQPTNVTFSGYEFRDDIFSINIQMGKLQIRCQVQLKCGYPEVHPVWVLYLESEPDSKGRIVVPFEYESLM